MSKAGKVKSYDHAGIGAATAADAFYFYFFLVVLRNILLGPQVNWLGLEEAAEHVAVVVVAAIRRVE